MTPKKVIKALTPPIVISMLKTLFETPETISPGPCEIQLRPDLNLKIHPSSRATFRYFEAGNSEMGRELDAFLKVGKQRRRLLDIGALHGVFSLAFTGQSKERTALAVDASPYAFSTLLYNIHSNPSCHIQAVECALSAEAGMLKMHYEWEHAVAAPLLPSDSSFLIAKRTADELCRDKNFLPDLIKVDVEGHEIEVLRGLAECLRNLQPALCLEYHPQRVISEGDSSTDLLKIMADYSYTAFHTNGKPLAKEEISRASQDLRMILLPKGESWPE